MERLSAIGGFEIQEALVVSDPYLSTPNLVGRDEQLAAFARRFATTFGGAKALRCTSTGSQVADARVCWTPHMTTEGSLLASH
jgi:hypothetical protein